MEPSRLAERGDVLRVRVGPRRSIVTAAFLSLWLAAWSAGGVAVIGALWSGEGRDVFFFVWLVLWAVGVVLVVVILAWGLRGRDVLIVGPAALEHRQEIGRWARVRTYELSAVLGVGGVAIRDEDGPRGDFGIEVSAVGRVFVAGEGLTAAEADYLAGVISDRLRRYTGGRVPTAAPAVVPKMPQTHWATPLAITGIVVLGVYAAARWLNDGVPRPTAEQEAAAAATLNTFSGGPFETVGRPECDAGATKTTWTCRVRAVGPGGRVVVYRCSSGGGNVHCRSER